jgi:drug/metabolite transporter (DMT)-like permease
MSRIGGGLPPSYLAAFLVIVVLGVSNVVAVRLGLSELAPFWAAALRFALAAGVLAAIALARRSPLPRGRQLLGATIYGLLNFFLGYALMYTALVDVPAGLAMIVFAIIPLLTLLLAVAHREESLSVRGVVGAVIAVAGVTISFGLGSPAAVPLVALGLLVLSALVAAEGSVLVKLIPPGDPVCGNLVGMTIGAVLLGGLSLVTGEPWALPDTVETWAAMLYLAAIGSVGLFLAYLWLLARWTASGTSYAVLLSPLWTMVAAMIVLDEPIAPAAVAGGAIVILGTWLGAFSTRSR